MKKGLGLKLLALAAVVAAVAFSGVVFNTQTADAVLGTQVGGNDNAGPYSPGTTVAVSSSAALNLATTAPLSYTSWTIDTTGAAEATFVAGGGSTLSCQDASTASACDTNPAAGTITVNVKIADNSGAGAVLVRATRFGGAATDTDLAVLTVDPGLTPTSITLVPDSTAISAGTTNNTTNLVVTVKNSLGRGVATNVNLITSFGQFSGSGGCASASQACTVATVRSDTDPPAATDGQPASAPQLQSLGSPGTATVTATIPGTSVSATAQVTFYGTAMGIAAAAEQDAIEIGGNTFIVVTVTDAAGSPVANHPIVSTASVQVTGPAIPSVPLTAASNVPKDINGNGVISALDGEIPHCDTTTPDTPDDVTDPATYAAGSTDANGQCVIQVMAPINATNPAANATRGTHTVKVLLAGTTESASVEINVGGPPDTITSDAPASINLSDEITVNITVLDDEGARVGKVNIEVVQTAGDGKIITEAAAETVGGRASFTYLAPSRPGVAEFLVRTRDGTPANAVTAALPIIVTIGEAEAEAEAPDAISIDLRAGGRIVAVTSSGPATTASALFGDAVNSAWKYNQDTGVWDVVYIPGRSGNFSINTGDILYVDSPIDQTVGG